MNHLNFCGLRKMNPIKPTDETFKAHLLFVLKAVGNQTNKKIEVQYQRRAVSDVSSHQPKKRLGKSGDA
jgi:hypothetical protein